MTENANERAAQETGEGVDLPEELEKLLVFALDEAQEKLAKTGEVAPFTCIVDGDKLLVESYPAEDVDEAFEAAERALQGASGAQTYALCYDGLVGVEEDGDVADGEADEDEADDALIAEGARRGDAEGHAIGLLYAEGDEGEGSLEFDDEPVYLGEAPNLLG